MAQRVDPARFTPLAIGDRWEYIYTQQEWPAGGSPGLEVIRGYLTTEVARDTVIIDLSFRVLVRREYDASGTLTASDSCAARVLEDGSIAFPGTYGFPDPWTEGMCGEYEVIDNQYSLPLQSTYYNNCFRADQTQAPGMVTVGGVVYEVSATAACHSQASHGSGWTFSYAADLGLYRWLFGSPPHYGDGFRFIYHLKYAEVGGNTYGTSPGIVVPEPPVPSAALTLGAPFPNPTDGRARVVISGTEAGGKVVEVFDATGKLTRRWNVLLQVTGGWVTVDTRGLPAGTYVIRITDTAGRSGSTALVKR